MKISGTDNIGFLEALLVAAKEGRVYFDRKDSTEIKDGKRYFLTIDIEDNKLSNLGNLIQECRSIDLRESLKVAAQINIRREG